MHCSEASRSPRAHQVRTERDLHGSPRWSEPSRSLCGWLTLGLLALQLDIAGASPSVFTSSCVFTLRGEQESMLLADGGSIPIEHVPPGTKPPRFVPSYEWQRVLPGQQVPPGLWIKMDVSSGATFAKFMGACCVCVCARPS